MLEFEPNEHKAREFGKALTYLESNLSLNDEELDLNLRALNESTTYYNTEAFFWLASCDLMSRLWALPPDSFWKKRRSRMLERASIRNIDQANEYKFKVIQVACSIRKYLTT